jgi:hypothetical protein
MCHVVSLDLSSGRSDTCPRNLARGVPLAFLLEELVPGQDVGSTSDPVPRPGLGQGRLFVLVPKVPHYQGIDNHPTEVVHTTKSLISLACLIGDC